MTVEKLQPAINHPPHSIESEQSVLGGIMLNNRAWLELTEILAEEDFYTHNHRVIFRNMHELLQRKKPVDFVTLSEHMRLNHSLEDGGGVSYLGTLAADTPSAANVVAYAEIVAARSVMRSLIAAGQDLGELGYRPDSRSSDELLTAAQQTVFAIKQRGKRASHQARSMGNIMDAVEERIEKQRNNPEAFAGLPTGFGELDKLTQGMHEGDLIIIGGRPGMGKTSLAVNIAEHVALERRKRTVVFSMEMSAEQLGLRLVSSFGRIDAQALRSGQLEDHDWSRLVSASGMLRESPLLIDETGSLSPLELAARARRLAAEEPLALVVVDYIQLMQVPKTRENRTNEISEISRNLKALAKELRCPVIALSQLSRALEARVNKRPVQADLRESGSIEQDADVVLFVYRDEEYNRESPHRGTAEIIVAKQRSGPTGMVRLSYAGKYTRFDNLAPEYAADIGSSPVATQRRRGMPDPNQQDFGLPPLSEEEQDQINRGYR